MGDMTVQIRRMILAFLVILLLGSMGGHLFLVSSNPAHAVQESTCPIHNGMLHAEKPQPLATQPAISIENAQDGGRALGLSAEILHPPTVD